MLIFIQLCLLIFSIACETCIPFGPRMFFGRSFFPNSVQNQAARILFNTHSSCQNSYITLSQDNTPSNITCSTKSLEVPASNYSTYIHNCSINVKLGRNFTYKVIGATSSGVETVWRNREILTSIVDPTINVLNQFIVLADWGKMNTAQYTPLDASFDELLRKNRSQIHGMVLNGDYGYNLDSNRCQNYQEFLEMISQVSVYWPLIMSTGNHEYKSKDNYKLYSQSFQLYAHEYNKLQSYFFKNIQFISVDFYHQIYENGTDSQSSIFLQKIQEELTNTTGKTPFKVVCSHFPIMCSGTEKICSTNNKTLFNYWSMFNDHSVDLALGAHVHTYERMYPYYKGKIYNVQGPYINIDSMVSIVEGLGGNDQGIVEQTYSLKECTAKATFNQTGFGILSVYNDTTIEYKHYSTLNSTHPFDNVVIGKSRRFWERKQLQIEVQE